MFWFLQGFLFGMAPAAKITFDAGDRIIVFWVKLLLIIQFMNHQKIPLWSVEKSHDLRLLSKFIRRLLEWRNSGQKMFNFPQQIFVWFLSKKSHDLHLMSSWILITSWLECNTLHVTLWGWKAKKSTILRFVLILQSQIFQHGAENFEVFKFQSQKCFWSKFKSRHGCYNPQRIICNHLKLWICWDAQEIKRFSISLGGDIFFATGDSWSQQLTSLPKFLLISLHPIFPLNSIADLVERCDF